MNTYMALMPSWVELFVRWMLMFAEGEKTGMVLTAKLLHKHDKIRRQRSAPIPPNGEEVLPVATAPGLCLDFQELMGVVHVPGRLDRVVS